MPHSAHSRLPCSPPALGCKVWSETPCTSRKTMNLKDLPQTYNIHWQPLALAFSAVPCVWRVQTTASTSLHTAVITDLMISLLSALRCYHPSESGSPAPVCKRLTRGQLSGAWQTSSLELPQREGRLPECPPCETPWLRGVRAAARRRRRPALAELSARHREAVTVGVRQLPATLRLHESLWVSTVTVRTAALGEEALVVVTWAKATQ